MPAVIDRFAGSYDQLEAILSQVQVGDVASDHRAEINGYQGWNYVAISAVCKHAARALVYVYDDTEDPSNREIRKRLRSERGGDWRKSYHRESKGEVLDGSHKLMKLLNRPNPGQTGSSFRSEQIQQLRLHGSCIVWNRPNAAGTRTVERYVVPWALVTPVQPGRYSGMPRGGVRIRPTSYMCGSAQSVANSFSPIYQFGTIDVPVEMLSIVRYTHPHFRGDGMSPTFANGKWIDSATAVDDMRIQFYGFGPNGQLIFESEDEDAAIIKQKERALQEKLGPNGQSVVVIAKGNRVAVQRSAEELGLNESSEQLKSSILATHHLSRAAVGDQDSMTYGSLAASLLASTILSVQPDMDLIADEDTLDLCSEPEWEGRSLTIEYEVPPIENPEMEDRRLEVAARNSAITIGELRTKLGYPMWGDERDDMIVTPTGPITAEEMTGGGQGGGGGMPWQFSHKSPIKKQLSKSFDVMDTLGEYAPLVAIEVDGTLCDQGENGKLGKVSDTARHAIEMLKSCGCEVSAVTSMDPDYVTEHLRSCGLDVQVNVDRDSIVWDRITDGVDGENRLNDLSGLLERIPDGRARRELQRLLGKGSAAKEYGVIMLKLGENEARAVQDIAKLIDPSHLAEGGVESCPHVTLLYGLVDSDVEAVTRTVKRMGAPEIEIGEIAYFPDSGNGCPLHLQVSSEQLHEMHNKIKKLYPHVQTHPEYKPHITIAYVLPEYADQYTGPSALQGVAIDLESAEIKLVGQEPVTVPLTAKIDLPDEVGVSVEAVTGVGEALFSKADQYAAAMDSSDIIERALKRIDERFEQLTKSFRPNPNAVDRNKDGLIYEGTKWEMPASESVDQSEVDETYSLLSKLNPDMIGFVAEAMISNGKAPGVVKAAVDQLEAERKAREPKKPRNVDPDASQQAVDIESANFREWFGDSKVVDEEGKPLVVYHGTEDADADFSEFKISNNPNEPGIWFTADPANADGYHSMGTYGAGAGSGTYAVYLSIQDPLEVDWQEYATKHGSPAGDGYSGSQMARLFREAREAGHDGLIIRGIRDGGYFGRGKAKSDNYVVFEPGQIKSALTNTGEFDPGNPDIRKTFTPNPNAVDRNKDGLLYEGTRWEMPARSLESGSVLPADGGSLEEHMAGSVLVNPDGSPIEFYHGTPSDFDRFSNSRKSGGTLGEGHYLARSEQHARLIQRIQAKKSGANEGFIKRVYVNAKNPLDIEAMGGLPAGGIDSQRVWDAGYDAIIYRNEVLVKDAEQMWIDSTERTSVTKSVSGHIRTLSGQRSKLEDRRKARIDNSLRDQQENLRTYPDTKKALRSPLTEESNKIIRYAGLAVLAKDTGRVLMLKRAEEAGDPASNQWEFPGGGCEEGERPIDAAIREWQEEVGAKLPPGEERSHWTDKAYRGHIYLIEKEELVTRAARQVPNEDGQFDLIPESKEPGKGRRQVKNPDGYNEHTEWVTIDEILFSLDLRRELRNTLPGFLTALSEVKIHDGEYRTPTKQVKLLDADEVLWKPGEVVKRSRRTSKRQGKLPRDANNNGLIFDGTDREQPAPEQQKEKPARKSKVKEKTKSPRAKSEIAKANAVYVGKDIQRYSEEHNEPILAAALKGASFLEDNEPADVVVKSKGKIKHGIELKTMTVGANRKLTMKKDAMDRKQQWEKKNGATFHTVVFDDTAVYNAKGPGKHDESKRRIFYRRGYGSFRVDTMHEVSDPSMLQKMLDMPAEKLPAGARMTKSFRPNPNAVDRNRDGILYRGTPWEMPARAPSSTGDSAIREGVEYMETARFSDANTGRFKPSKEHVFEQRITGPSGASLLSYKWVWKPGLYIDPRDGDLKERKESDWDQAMQSAESGRGVVHQFTVETPDGQTQLVSLEGALRVMGYMKGIDGKGVKSLATSLKSMALKELQLKSLQEQKAAVDEQVAMVASMPRPPIEYSDTALATIPGWRMGDAAVADRTATPGGEISEERARVLDEAWANKRLAEAGIKLSDLQLGSKISEVEKQIEKARKKVQAQEAIAAQGL